MKLIFPALALLAIAVPALAQENRATTERQVINQPVFPEPANRDIVVKFGEVTQVHFKRPFKSVRVGDGLVVAVTPKTDHILEFTGLSPGTSELTFESNDGITSRWGTVTIVREQHEVKLFLPPPRLQGSTGSTGPGGITIVNQSGPTTLQTTDSPDYRSLLCNEVSCSQPAGK